LPGWILDVSKMEGVPYDNMRMLDRGEGSLSGTNGHEKA